MHEKPEYSPILANVIVLLLVKNTTAELQPLDVELMASIKHHHNKYRTKQAGLIESGCTQKICDCDVVIAMKNILEIMERLESSVIKNIWEIRVI